MHSGDPTSGEAAPHQPVPASEALPCARCAKLETKLEAAEQERRELMREIREMSAELREINAENRQMAREIKMLSMHNDGPGKQFK